MSESANEPVSERALEIRLGLWWLKADDVFLIKKMQWIILFFHFATLQEQELGLDELIIACRGEILEARDRICIQILSH